MVNPPQAATVACMEYGPRSIQEGKEKKIEREREKNFIDKNRKGERHRWPCRPHERFVASDDAH
jgi:hypothetical protein